jgi:HSP20 family protein
MRRVLTPFFANIPLAQVRSEVDRVFSDFFAPSTREWQDWLPRVGGGPRLNVWDENDTIVAEAEVPGLKPEDLDVSVVGDQLTIKGRRESTVESGHKDGEKNGNDKAPAYHRRERTVGEFLRTVTLPVEVNADNVRATLVHGVLTIKLPKAEKAKPRKITVS